MNKLTIREKEILALAKAGLSSKQIATNLKIKKTTVDVHFKNIRQKLKLIPALRQY